MVGYYHFAKDAAEVGKLAPSEREAHALAQGEKIHPQYRGGVSGSSFSVAWQRIPYNLGGWASGASKAARELYPILNRAGRPVFPGAANT